MMANFSTAMQVGGAVTSTIGAYNKSKGEKAAYEYQAQVAANNKQITEWQVSDAAQRRTKDLAAQQLKQRQFAGSQRAAMAANGVDITEGSALNILSDTEFMGQLDQNTIKDNSNKEIFNYKVQGANFDSNSEMLKMRADAENPMAAAGSTFLTGAGAVADGWYKKKQAGIKGY
jgi:hypothetical protein